MKNLEYLITTVDGNDYDYKEEDRLINKSIDSLGDGGKNQIIITIEELSELTQAILNYMKDNNSDTFLNLAEEITDVLICLGYVNFVFNLDSRDIIVTTYSKYSPLEVIYDVSKLSQTLTKHLRGKTDLNEIHEMYVKIINELKFLSNYYFIEEELIIKIRKLKIERLRRVLEEGETY